MKRVIVQYKVKADKAEENVAYIQAVFQALNETKPEGLRYASFQSEDGVSFTHIASIETEDGSNPLSSLDEFDAFTEDIGSRCEIPPAAAVVNTVGAYGAFD
jgi:hypothetical protein